MTTNTAKPASLTDIAFDTGRIAERARIVSAISKELRQFAENPERLASEIGFFMGLTRALELTKEEEKTEETEETDEPSCSDCEDEGWVYKRIDVDAEKRVPCDCGRGEPND